VVKRAFRTTKAAHLENLQVFRDFIDMAASECNLDPEVTFALKLAMDEACTNIIQHGYAGRNPGSIILDLAVGDREAELRITDFGRTFEPSAAPMPDLAAALEDRQVGGFGLFFIYTAMDNVDYTSGEAGNTLILTKMLVNDAV
jgi:serine/threonine-protein kinase RsbW